MTHREPTPKTLGEIVQDILKEEGLTKRSLAQKTGITDACVNRIVNNKHTPSIDRAINVLEALGYTLVAVKQGSELPQGAIRIVRPIEDKEE